MTNMVSTTDRVWLYAIAALTVVLLGLAGETVARNNRLPGAHQDGERHFLSILRDRQAQENQPDAVVTAIERLGGMRSVAAIDDLINLITFKRTLPEQTTLSPIQGGLPKGTMSVYPATEALFHIGEPALPALIAVIEASDAEALESQNAFYTVMAIFREDREAGVGYLEKAANQAKSTERASNLWRAAQRARSFLLK
jgi:hypothetical protein